VITLARHVAMGRDFCAQVSFPVQADKRRILHVHNVMLAARRRYFYTGEKYAKGEMNNLFFQKTHVYRQYSKLYRF